MENGKRGEETEEIGEREEEGENDVIIPVYVLCLVSDPTRVRNAHNNAIAMALSLKKEGKQGKEDKEEVDKVEVEKEEVDKVDKIQFPTQIIGAIDANAMTSSPHHIDKLVERGLLRGDPDMFIDNAYPGRPVLMGQIACYLSHMSLLDRARRSKHGIIVIEDDMVVLDNFTRVMGDLLSSSSKIRDSCCYVNMFVPDYQRKMDIFKVVDQSKSKLVTLPPWLHGTNCYYVSPSGAKAILQAASPMRMPIDNFIAVLNDCRLNAFVLNPRYASIVKDTSTSSTSTLTPSHSSPSPSNIWTSKTLVEVMKGSAIDPLCHHICRTIMNNCFPNMIADYYVDTRDTRDTILTITDFDLLRLSGWSNKSSPYGVDLVIVSTLTRTLTLTRTQDMTRTMDIDFQKIAKTSKCIVLIGPYNENENEKEKGGIGENENEQGGISGISGIRLIYRDMTDRFTIYASNIVRNV
jgi:GR25 family glycosyltransferase involved in LPS biosynthesis